MGWTMVKTFLLITKMAFAASIPTPPEAALQPLCPFDAKKAEVLFQPAFLKNRPILDIAQDFSRLGEAYGKCESVRQGKNGAELAYKEAVIPLDINRNDSGLITKLGFFSAEFRDDTLAKAVTRAQKLFPEGFSYALTDDSGKLISGHLAESALEVGESSALIVLKEFRRKEAAGIINGKSVKKGQSVEQLLAKMILEKNEAARSEVLKLSGEKKFTRTLSTAKLCELLVGLKEDPILRRVPSSLRRFGTWEMVVGESSWAQGVRQVTELLLPPGKTAPICLSITINSGKGVDLDRAEEVFLRIFKALPQHSAAAGAENQTP